MDKNDITRHETAGAAPSGASVLAAAPTASVAAAALAGSAGTTANPDADACCMTGQARQPLGRSLGESLGRLRAPRDMSAGPPGSRRRRLWELGSHAHCPVIGVCLPLASLRRLTSKVLGGQPQADDHVLHCGVVADCQRRTRLADALQRELDRRFMTTLRRAAEAKTTEALAAWWQAQAAGKDLPGALWATLTHVRCDTALESQVLAQVHMVQHQVGMATRVELAQFEALIDENAALGRELGAAQRRCTQQASAHAVQAERLRAETVRLRGQLLARDSTIAMLHEQAEALHQAAPDLASRMALARDNASQAERIVELRRALQAARAEVERLRASTAVPVPVPVSMPVPVPVPVPVPMPVSMRVQMRTRTRTPTPTPTPMSMSMPMVLPTVSRTTVPIRALPAPPVPHAADDATAEPLNDRAVLCVGGRTASVPVYRRLVEDRGARFLHHDGGTEDKVHQFDAILAAADLVICQTGCVSHDAYWRVKDHCKRTGKRCIFVKTPSATGLQRALQALSETT